VLAKIYLGKITKWNAPEIVALNPGVKFPADEITVVHRADGSGTTFLWTDYLSKVSPDFKTTVGASTAVKWPLGVGGKGNEGVRGQRAAPERFDRVMSNMPTRTRTRLNHAQMKNHDGQFVQPNDTSFKAAAAVRGVDEDAGLRGCVDRPGRQEQLADYRCRVRHHAQGANGSGQRARKY